MVLTGRAGYLDPGTNKVEAGPDSSRSGSDLGRPSERRYGILDGVYNQYLPG